MHGFTNKSFYDEFSTAILLFLLPLWKTLGLGTAMSTTMVKTMMKPLMRSKRSLSEDIGFPSSFLVLDVKGGEEVLSI
jgi:hypothetical protein